MPAFLTRAGRRRVLDPNATVGLKPRTPGGRTLIPATDLTALDVVVSSGKPGKGNISLGAYNGLYVPTPGGGSLYPAGVTHDGDKFTIVAPSAAGATAYRLYLNSRGTNSLWYQAGADQAGPTFTSADSWDNDTMSYRVTAFVGGVEQTQFLQDLKAPAQTYQAPITVNVSGAVITGKYRSLTPGVSPITLAAGVSATVTGCRLVGAGGASGVTNTGALIIGRGGNTLVARNNYGYSPHLGVANIYGMSSFLEMGSQPVACTFENNYGQGVRFGVYLNCRTGGGAATNTLQTLVVRYNRFKNLQGLQAKADGTFDFDNLASYGVGHAFQVSYAYDITTAEISWNEVVNEVGLSLVQDVFNIYISSGKSTGYGLVHHNTVYGQYAPDPTGTSSSGPRSYNPGCGFISDGDPDAANPLRHGYWKFYNNRAVACQNVGLALAHGNYTEWYNNRAVASGYIPGGAKVYFQNVGIYGAEQGGLSTTRFTNNNFHDNLSTWTRAPATSQNAGGSNFNNPYYFDSGTYDKVGANNVKTNNNSLPQASLADEYAEHLAFWAEVKAASLTVGAA